MKNKTTPALQVGVYLLLTFFSSSSFAATQDSWRYCKKCHLMFYDGFPKKGVCSAGGEHVASGYNFILPYGFRETKQAQTEWRFCKKCYALFYNGFPQKELVPPEGDTSPKGLSLPFPMTSRPRA